ncbi:MAG: H-NS histone family protein [Dechloromonas sp.]|uniref:H-NS histone family protein n=1 Tax=Dechloromonas sp. TaxID=1917218 RepID=UPI0027EA382B|nr:H-NS histone family protein [Dechloromonas sp.]MBT9521302.1 H-NS histone family protein [Dechloromonas sp.]
MDISQLSIAQLKELLDQIPAEIKRREKQEKTRIRQELEALAAKSGYTLDELLGEASEKVRKASKPVAVKYRHPKDLSLGWSGRGRQPKWVVEFLSADGALDQLAV